MQPSELSQLEYQACMMKPNFLIIGERRCGTTTLYHWLNNHPDIFLFPKTDTAYFIENELVGRTKWLDGKVSSKRWEEEHSLQDYSALFAGSEGYKAVGEKSADIFYWQPAHHRVASYLPESKFIVQLRNPIFRAWSHYWNEIGKGRETESFEDAIHMEASRSGSSDYAGHHLSYLQRGQYHESLSSFFEHIPKENLMILILEETKRYPQETFKKICTFLEVDNSVILDSPLSPHNHNWTMVKRNWANQFPFNYMDNILNRGMQRVAARFWKHDPDRIIKKRKFLRNTQFIFRQPAKKLKMTSTTFNKLKNHYIPHNLKLEAILNRKITHWNI